MILPESYYPHQYFKPIGRDEENTIGYREIMKEEFMLSNFSMDDKKIIYERRIKLKRIINNL